MTDKRIENDSIVAPDLFVPTTKNAEDLNATLMATIELLKGILAESVKIQKNTPFEGYDNAQKVAKSIEDVDKAVEGLAEAEKERAKLQERLAKLRTQEAEDNEVIRQQIVATRKELRERAKLSGGLLDAYQQESKRLNTLRKRYKNLASQNQENTKEGRRLRKEIQQLDKRLKDIDATVGQNQRKVGEYERAFKDLREEVKRFATIGFVFKILEGLSSAFTANSRTGAELEKVIGRFTVTLSVFISRVADAIPQIKAFFSDLSNGASSFIKGFQLAFLEATNLVGNNDKAIQKLKKEIEELNKTAFDGKAFAKAFEGIGDEISKTIEANDKLINTTLRYRKEISALTESVAKNAKAQSNLSSEVKALTEGEESLLDAEARLEIASGDNTLSLQERLQATKDLMIVQDEINRINIQVATKEQDLARRQLSVSKASIEAREELSRATVALGEAEAKAATDRANALKEVRDIESDDIERRLDFLIDLADKQKQINDEIIANEKSTFEEREKARQDNIAIERDLLNKANKELNKATKEEIDLNKLKVESDNLTIAEKSKNAGLNDRLVGRVLELIRDDIDLTREQKQAKDELNESEKKSNEIAKESELIGKALEELRKEGIDSTEVLNMLEKDRLQLTIDNLNARLSLAKEGSAEAIQIQKELNEALLEQAGQQAEQQSAIEKKKQDNLAELRETALDATQEFFNKQFDAQQQAINREISANERRIERLNELAARGEETATDNLAVAEARRAELELKRERQQRQKAQFELVLAGLKAYSANLENGGNPAGALAQTGFDITSLRALLANIPAFYGGSDRLGDDVKPIMPGKDGIVIRADKEEMIFNPTESKMVRDSGLSRLEVATMAQMYGKGNLPHPVSVTDYGEVVTELKEVTKAIENQPVFQGIDYDVVTKMLTEHWKKGNKAERIHRKAKGGVFD